MSQGQLGKVVGLSVAVITAGLLLSVQSWVRAASHPFRIQADAPLELVVYPSTWTVTSRNSGTNMIAVKGINGFSGTATVTVSGLPSTVLDRYPSSSELASGKGGYYCSSHCISASNADFPMSLSVNNGGWTSIGPTLLPGASIEAQTKTVTITATANGQSVSKSFTLKVINDEPIAGPGGFTYAGTANPDVIATINDASWGGDQYKLTSFAAGTSKTKQIDVQNLTSSSQSVTVTSNISGSGLGDVTSGFTGSLGSTSLSLAANERKAVDVTLSPSASVPNGTYEVIFGITQADGSNRAGVGMVAEVTGGTGSSGSVTSSPSSSSSSASSSSNSSTSNSSGQQSVSSTPAPSSSESTAPVSTTEPSTAPQPAKKPAKAGSPPRLEVPLRHLLFHAENGQPAADQTLELKNSGPRDSVLRYYVASGSDWLTVTPTEGEIAGGRNVVLQVSVAHEGLTSGTRIGEIVITQSDRATDLAHVTVNYQLDLFKFSLPSIYTNQVFSSSFRPGFSYDWSIGFGNEGTASATVGLLVPIPSEYKLDNAQIFGSGGEILAQEPGVVVAAAQLNPMESRTLRLSLRILPSTVQFPGQPTEPGRVLQPGQTLPVPKPFIFSTLSPERWQALKSSASPSEFPARAFKESLETTEAQMQTFRAISDQAQYQSLLELSNTHPYMANNLASYVMLEDYTSLATAHPLTGLVKRPPVPFASLIPQVASAQAQDRSIWQRLGNEVEYYKNFGIDVARSTAGGFADGRHRDALAGLGSGAVEVASFGLLSDSVPPAYGHQTEYNIGRTTGIIAGTAESFLIPGAIQAGPKAAMIIAKGGTKSEPLHFGVDLVAKGGMVYRDGEAVNLIHVGKHVEHGWHVGLYGAGKPFVTESGQKVVGTWAHFYPSKAYIAGIGEIPYAGLLPTPISSALFGLFGGRQPPTLGVANDPNHLSSVPAEGPVRSTEAPITFHIDFENLKDATASATQVEVTAAIDDDFDLGSATFLTTSHADHVQTQIDEATRTLRWRFTNLELPPNVTPPEGEGFAEFSIRPKSDLASGTELTSSASIVFDFNPAIATNTLTHRLDMVAPATAVERATTRSGKLVIDWTATDLEPASGLAEVRLFVTPSDGTEGVDVVATEEPMIVKVARGKTYEIRSLATDRAGNVSQLSEPVSVNVPRPWWLYALIILLAAWGIRKIVQRVHRRRRAIRNQLSAMRDGAVESRPRLIYHRYCEVGTSFGIGQ